MGGSATAELAEFVAATGYGSLPPATRAVARLVLLDAVGAAVAGAAVLAGDSERLVEAGRGLGAGDSTALAVGGGRSAEAAAFLGGGLVHALNLDAVGPGMSHLGVCVPAALALADEVDADVERLVAAVAVGAEVAARLAVAGDDPAGRRGWLGGQVLTYFAATAAAAKVVGMDAAGVHSALGMALMQAGGTMEIMQGGDRPVKAFYGSFPNLAAVLAVRMSAAGLDARSRALDGRLGLLRQFFGVEATAGLVEGLGARFRVEEALFKHWPVSAFVHPYVAAAIGLDGPPRDRLERLVVRVPAELGAYAEPLAAKLRPSSAAEAGNSVPYCVARALLDGRLALDHFTAAGLASWAAGEGAAVAAGRVEPRLVESAEDAGLELHARGAAPLDVPLSPAEDVLASGPAARDLVEEKFRAALRWAGYGDERTGRLRALVMEGGGTDRARSLTGLTGRA